MDFFEPGLPRNRRGSMLVEGPEVARELKLLVDTDLLVAEDYEKVRTIDQDSDAVPWVDGMKSLTHNTALSDEEGPKVVSNVSMTGRQMIISKDGMREEGEVVVNTHSSSF